MTRRIFEWNIDDSEVVHRQLIDVKFAAERAKKAKRQRAADERPAVTATRPTL